MQPKYLKETVWIMSFFNVASIFFINWNTQYLVTVLTITVSVTTFTFYVLFKYWQGKNWARLLVMFSSVLALINLISIDNLTSALSVLLILEALFAAFILWWLNTAPVKQYFKRVKEITQR